MFTLLSPSLCHFSQLHNLCLPPWGRGLPEEENNGVRDAGGGRTENRRRWCCVWGLESSERLITSVDPTPFLPQSSALIPDPKCIKTFQFDVADRLGSFELCPPSPTQCIHLATELGCAASSIPTSYLNRGKLCEKLTSYQNWFRTFKD